MNEQQRRNANRLAWIATIRYNNGRMDKDRYYAILRNAFPVTQPNEEQPR